MRIALIQPNSSNLMYPFAFPSLGLLYISAYLKNHGYNPDFYDLTGGKELPDVQADVIAFTCQITHFRDVCQMKARLEKINPHAKFVIGGPFPTHSPEMCEREGFIVIKGEGENQMLQLLGEKADGYVDPNFFPDWKAIDLNKYGYSLEGKRCINIMTKRGNCPYKCAFCAKQESGKSPLRFRTAENVLAEARYLKSCGFGALAIYDDDVLLNKKRDREIFKGLKVLGMPYRCMTRTNLATREDLQLLKDTGCAEVAIGIETADPKLHDVINKMTSLEQDREFVRIANEIGLRTKAYLIIGLPGETRESVEKTRQWMREVKPTTYDLSILTPYPGSDIYKNKQNYEIDWDEENLRLMWFDGEAQYGKCAVSTPCLTANEILELKEDFDSEFKRGKGGITDYWKPI